MRAMKGYNPNIILAAEPDRPYIGLQLDPEPPGELLAKHLHFEPGQGLRISNVAAGSPADRTGLERDDILLEFQGEPIRGLEEFIDRVRTQRIGQEVELVVIHLGQRRPVHLELAPLHDAIEWKYPFEPELETWSPGRIYRIPPGQDDWIEIPFDQMPDVEVPRFLQEVRTYTHVDDEGELTVTVVGDPRKEDSSLIVKSEGTQIETTIGQIDKLPEKFRDRVRRIVEQAVEQTERRPRLEVLPSQPSVRRWREFMDDVEKRVRIPRLTPSTREKILDELRERMDRLDERLEEMRHRQEELFDRLRERLEDSEDRDRDVERRDPRRARDRDREPADSPPDLPEPEPQASEQPVTCL